MCNGKDFPLHNKKRDNDAMKQLYYDVKKCLGCRSCEIACSVAHSAIQDLFKAIRENKSALPRKKVASSGGKNYPVSCRHCQEPKCVDACMAYALTFDHEKGFIFHDESRCVGCWMCVMVCPYGAIRPDLKEKTPIRCDKCMELPSLSSKGGTDLDKEGRGEDEPACVKACPTGAIIWQEEIKLVKE
jgi:carbon-monoxide dehydrogenase iron sulfur subunit